ncbi:MAG: alpha/beta hydrolase [Solirubrobacteraceae bacterium]
MGVGTRAAADTMARVRRSRRQSYSPVPPREMLPARTIIVPGRGEFFLRDSGEADPPRPTVLLLHGWMVTADLNWHGAYDALVDAGYRVLAVDHRGHGRGLRAMAPFRLEDCAADAAAILRELGAAPAIVVGYSMGGTIAQLMARDHPDVMSGLVLSGTCQHFQDPETRRIWKWMGVVGLTLGLAPRQFYRSAFRSAKIRLNERTAWWLSELMRHEARDVAEAGRELGRFDSRPWLASLTRIPTAMVLTRRDHMVAPAKQRELAQAVGATVFEVDIDHLDVTDRADEYDLALVSALAAVTAAQSVPVA